MDFAITSMLNTNDLMDEMATNLPTNVLVDFVIELDALESNWDFTEQLYKYFKSQHRIFKAEC